MALDFSLQRIFSCLKQLLIAFWSFLLLSKICNLFMVCFAPPHQLGQQSCIFLVFTHLYFSRNLQFVFECGKKHFRSRPWEKWQREASKRKWKLKISNIVLRIVYTAHGANFILEIIFAKYLILKIIADLHHKSWKAEENWIIWNNNLYSCQQNIIVHLNMWFVSIALLILIVSSGIKYQIWSSDSDKLSRLYLYIYLAFLLKWQLFDSLLFVLAFSILLSRKILFQLNFVHHISHIILVTLTKIFEIQRWKYKKHISIEYFTSSLSRKHIPRRKKFTYDSSSSRTSM